MPHRAADDGKSAHFAFAVDDFFVGQNGPQFRAPIHRHLRDVSEPDAVWIVAAIGRDGLGFFRLGVEPRIVNLEKDPLRPFVVAGIGRVDLAFPIVGKTDPFQLRFELRDVLAGRDRGMLAGLDGVLFGRQTERVPAHRMEDVESVQSLVARDDVGGGVTFGMADVESRAARVGEHVEHVELRLTRIEVRFAGIGRVKCAGLIPDRLPLRLQAIERIRFAALIHSERIRNTEKQEGNKKSFLFS